MAMRSHGHTSVVFFPQKLSMKFTVAATTLISLAPAVLGLTVNAQGNAVQCQPLLLTWSDGTPPYFLTLIPAGQVSAPPLETFPTQTGNELAWVVDLK
ncbi:hypothetical protein BJ322DRAFT_1113689 [Thelephora terrestris]|uniref:Uncharacterized protein n=1 Tax=Thelephora terrestris TaxID=56493 RepID=A0A9P6H4J1_9AGAM|nr:hypothetical protein BJ322DRAFT_1113689 [Thelephora terrestris]